jgi:hypothetical protein
MSLELQDDDTRRIIAIGGNLGENTLPEYSGKGIPCPLLAYATGQLNKTICSSPKNGGAGVCRTDKATAMWDRMVASGNAVYNPLTDIYTFIP